MNEQTNRTLQLQRMYIKDCSVECPNSPGIFNTGGETQFKIDLNVDFAKMSDNQYETVLTLQTTATMGETTLFLIEVKYGCMYEITGFSEQDIEHIVQIWAPAQVFPFARELVAQLSSSAGFPQLLLPAVNFEQYYESRKAQASGGPAPSIQ